MEKAYSRIKWENYPSIATPLNETNLNKMDMSLDEVDNRVLGLDTAKLDKAVANTMVKDIAFNEKTGIFTITLLDGTTKTIDTKLEKVATNFSYDYETQKLVLTLVDGTKQEIDMSTLISQYEFADTSTIGFTVGNEGKITAIVKDGSITEAKLQPNFLANVKTEVSKAKSYADSSYENATTSRNAVTEAKQYRDEALQFRNEAESFAPEGYAELKEQVQENTVKVDTIIEKADLRIKADASGEEIHLTDSAEGKAVEFALYGKAKQNTTTGNQLANLPDVNTFTNGDGITWSCTNGVVTVSGTANGMSSTLNKLYYDMPIVAGAYIASGEHVYIRIARANDTIMYYNSGQSFTLDGTEKRVSLYCQVSNGETVNKTIYPMLNKGTTALPFEPFTNGASPNPQYPQPIEVSGESYNLLENTATSQTINGVEFVVNEDKSITANGTATANASIIIILSTPLVSDDYIFSGVSGGNADTYFMDLYAEGWTKNVVLLNGERTLSQEVAIVRIVVKSGYKAENITFYPMIRKASVKNNRYMPYKKGSVEVNSCGKNLLDKKNNIADAYIDTSANKIASSNGYYVAYAKINPNTKYTISKNEGNQFRIATFENIPTKGSSFISTFANHKAKTITFTSESNANYVVIGYWQATDGNAHEEMLNSIQLEQGEQATEYQPYKETTATIPTTDFAGIKVSINGNYTDQNGQQWICDEIVKYADGSGEYIKRISKDVIIGDREIRSVNDGNFGGKVIAINYDYCLQGVNKNRTMKMCDKLSYSGERKQISYKDTKVGTWGFNTGDDSESDMFFVFCIDDETVTTIDLAQQWLNNNPLTVYYILAEPIHTPLTAEEIAEIEKLHTFYPITNISNDFDCGMKITYNCDSKNYIDKKISELATAMVNNI